MTRYLGMDFDGVLASLMEDPWKIGPPIDGVRDAVNFLRTNGWKVIIYSVRGSMDIVRWLADNDIEVDYVNCNPEVPGQNAGKPYADVYVCDKTVTFRGDWESAIQAILEFEPWWAPKKEEKEEEEPEEEVENGQLSKNNTTEGDK